MNQTFSPALTESDQKRLLISNRDVQVTNDPSFVGCIDNYLPQPIYDELMAHFPDERVRINYTDECRLEHPDSACRAFWSEAPVAKALADYMSSEPFLGDLKDWLMPAMWQHRRERDPRDWVYVNDWPRDKGTRTSKHVKVSFKFSHMTRGDFLRAHTDEPCKVLSLILYFAQPEWQESWGGGTDFYEPKYRIIKNNWHNVFTPLELMNRAYTCRFVPNRLVMILKTRNSWHGVSPLACPPGTRRRTFLISFHDDAYRQEERAFQYRKRLHGAVTNSLMWMEKKKSA